VGQDAASERHHCRNTSVGAIARQMKTILINNLFQTDFRVTVLENIISGLTKSMNFLFEKNRTIPEFDGLFLAEQVEPVIGLGFVAYQNYIIGTISDLKEFSNNTNIKNFKKHLFYLDDSTKINGKLTRIELIISLANYYKHKDEGINSLTKENLDRYDLLIEDFPINSGLTLLTEKWNLNEVTNYVLDWRKNLELKYIK
jgi:hypothetical protein